MLMSLRDFRMIMLIMLIIMIKLNYYLLKVQEENKADYDIVDNEIKNDDNVDNNRVNDNANDVS